MIPCYFMFDYVVLNEIRRVLDIDFWHAVETLSP